MENLNLLTEKIIGACYTVSNTLGSGFLEKVYENALYIELRKHNIAVIKQSPSQVLYDKHLVGEFYIDLMIEDTLVVEVKAVKELNEVHQSQLMNYLVASNKRCGLLINFGRPKIEIKRMLNGY